MDIWDKEKRSQVMSKIRSKNTKPELTLRKALFAKGFRYRVNDKKLPGKPDIVLPKHKTVIFVHGCFWHKHEACKYAYTPKTNNEFWIDKIKTKLAQDSTYKFLNPKTLETLFVFDQDCQELPAQINNLESQILMQYYESSWKNFHN